MRAKTWSQVINATTDLNDQWLEYKINEIGLGRQVTWYYDQWITTLGILKEKICNVPPWSALWNNKGLHFDAEFDDSKQCWHGQGYKDCNIDIHIVPHGCKWFHFFPFQTFQEHVDKFNELTDFAYNPQVTDLYAK